MALQSLNRSRGGGQYFLSGHLPVIVDLTRQGWRLSGVLPGFREAYLLDRKQQEGWLLRLQETRRFLKETGLDRYRFSTRREALSTFKVAAETKSEA